MEGVEGRGGGLDDKYKELIIIISFWLYGIALGNSECDILWAKKWFKCGLMLENNILPRFGRSEKHKWRDAQNSTTS